MVRADPTFIDERGRNSDDDMSAHVDFLGGREEANAEVRWRHTPNETCCRRRKLTSDKLQPLIVNGAVASEHDTGHIATKFCTRECVVQKHWDCRQVHGFILDSPYPGIV